MSVGGAAGEAAGPKSALKPKGRAWGGFEFLGKLRKRDPNLPQMPALQLPGTNLPDEVESPAVRAGVTGCAGRQAGLSDDLLHEAEGTRRSKRH